MELIEGAKKSSWIAVIYGPPGIGKSSLAAFSDNPMFIDLEGGLDIISNELQEKHNNKLSRTPRLETYAEFIDALKYASESKFKTIVIDTISALETILAQKVLDDDPKHHKSLAEFGWQQGFEILAANWSLVIKHLRKLKEKYDKNILLIGHSKMQRIDDPMTDGYDSYTIDTHKKCLSTIVNNVDAVLFARHDIVVREKENSHKTKATGTGDRYLHCLEQPSFTAKNRFGLPDRVKMTPEIFKTLG